MHFKSPRRLTPGHAYFLLIAISLVGLLQAPSVISSSAASEEHQTSHIFFGDSSEGDYPRRLTALSQLWQNPADKIAPRVLADIADDGNATVVILLADQADLSAAYSMQNQDARGWFVYNTLKQHAARTQTGLREFLSAKGVSYQSFWAANMLVATADRNLVDQLAARADVARVDSNLPTRWIEDPAINKQQLAPQQSEAVEWGVLNVNAPAVWALGFNGAGIVVGDLDTGMRWTHNALKPKYRGWNGSTADHNFNWHDAIHSGGGICGANTVAPCDDSGHGTHTAGIMVGDDGAGNQIGVAPGAKWIGCRNMDQGNGTPATYTECFQFTIAPTDLAGNNPNPALRPHVLNNSWGCPASEGCVTRAELETIISNTQAAGIFVVASAGNAGPGCATVQDPPGIYNDSFSIGAIDINNLLAGFSSRGPSTYYTPNLLKPNISAPGVNVRSTYRTSDTTYVNLSGTSMASPHVAGVVALLWSARPQLVRNIASTKLILQNTASQLVSVAPAQTCGGTASTQIPNNSFGYGRVDALAAVNSVPTATAASIAGQVTTPDGQPLAGVTVRMSGAGTRKTITDSNGSYRFDNVDTNQAYTVTPVRVNYSFNPSDRSFVLASNKSDATFTASPETVVASPIDSPDYFVRQHYVDFLGREPDESGFNFWSEQIAECGGDAGCVERRRINVSAAYFLSIEFQETGGLVEGLYRASYARRPLYAEFVPDAKLVAQNVIVGSANWSQQLAANKEAFLNAWVQRGVFRAAYDGLTNEAFVDTLISHTSRGFNGDRAALVTGLNSSTLTRAAVLGQIVENDGFLAARRNQMFVMMEYFGYLRRDPDEAGYQFWLDKLNAFGGNFEQAEMVKAFIVSGEYRERFPR
ncbi:MAG: serine protease AprX [Pyrinomonadaceae bacterium]|jgi:subtilisin family serine protease|nr:serine protease AprX [Pyrinomonadaceae bacterium]